MTTISTPLYVIAGQSNARRLDSTRIFTDAVDARGIAGDIVRITEGGTTMEGRETRNDWYPFEDGDPETGELVDELVQTIRDNLAENPEAYIAGFVWLQGESDANSKFPSDDYQEKLQGLYDLVTAEFGADFPFMVMQLSENAPGIAEGHVGDWDSVAAAQASFVANNANTILLDPDDIAVEAGIAVEDMFRDNFHFQDSVYSVMAETILDLIAAQSTTTAPILIDGTSAAELMIGNAGADIIKGRRGADTIKSLGGDDLVEGGNGADIIELGSGDDFAYGGRGFDQILSGAGNDTIWAGRGNDSVAGSDGADTIYGGNGNARIVGGKQNDALFGGNGFDQLMGGRGDDLLTGGAGVDTFIFRFQQQNGYDTILDFETGLDRLQIEGGGSANDVVLTDLGDRVQVTINAISFEIMTDAGQIVALDDFIFA
jgi:carbohydrate esterase-like sialic acid-specific acetylesterase/hemolysin type calcium-binding protein